MGELQKSNFRQIRRFEFHSRRKASIPFEEARLCKVSTMHYPPAFPFLFAEPASLHYHLHFDENYSRQATSICRLLGDEETALFTLWDGARRT